MDCLDEAKALQHSLYDLIKNPRLRAAVDDGVQDAIDAGLKDVLKGLPKLPWETRRSLQRLLFLDLREMLSKEGGEHKPHKSKSENRTIYFSPGAYVVLRGLTAVFQSIPIDPAYTSHRKKRGAVIAERLAADRYVREAYVSWKHYGEGDRKGMLRHIEGIVDETLSGKSLRFLPLEEISIDGKTRTKNSGAYDKGIAYIYPNSRSKTEPRWWDSLPKSMLAFFHEKDHHHQDQIAVASNSGKLSFTDVFFWQGKYFEDYYVPWLGSSGQVVYVPPEICEEAYDALVIERASVKAEKVVSLFVELMRQNLKLDDPRRMWGYTACEAGQYRPRGWVSQGKRHKELRKLKSRAPG
jgi:hypothetical protein